MKIRYILFFLLLVTPNLLQAQGFIEYTETVDGRHAIPPNASTRIASTSLRLYDYGGFGGSVFVRPYSDVIRISLFRSTSADVLGAHLFEFEPGTISSGNFGSSGSQAWTYVAQLTPDDANDLRAGNWWIVVITPGFPNGELRGQLPAVPEPSAVFLAALAIAAVLTFIPKKQGEH